jgi:putative transposase
VIERNQFDSYYEAKDTIQRFIKHYNESRLHRSIGFVTPQQKWGEAMACDTTIIEKVSN